MNRACASGCTAEARFFAPTNTARDTSPADAARESRTPERITSAFVACANRTPGRRDLPDRIWPEGTWIARDPDLWLTEESIFLR